MDFSANACLAHPPPPRIPTRSTEELTPIRYLDICLMIYLRDFRSADVSLSDSPVISTINKVVGSSQILYVIRHQAIYLSPREMSIGT